MWVWLLDIDALLFFVAEDCVVQTNSRVPYYGRNAVREPLKRYVEAYSVTHELLNIFGHGGQLGAEMLTHHAPTRGGRTIIVPTATFYDRNSAGLLQSIRHFVDDSPLSGCPFPGGCFGAGARAGVSRRIARAADEAGWRYPRLVSPHIR